MLFAGAGSSVVTTVGLVIKVAYEWRKNSKVVPINVNVNFTSEPSIQTGFYDFMKKL
jgi:hypothetical protein